MVGSDSTVKKIIQIYLADKVGVNILGKEVSYEYSEGNVIAKVDGHGEQEFIVSIDRLICYANYSSDVIMGRGNEGIKHGNPNLW